MTIKHIYKIFLFFSVTTLFILGLLNSETRITHAQYTPDIISTSANINYSVSAKTVRAQYQITISTSSNYPTVLNYYSIQLPIKNISNYSASSGPNSFLVTPIVRGENTEISIDFNGQVVKQNAPFNFTLAYELNNTEIQLSDSYNYVLPAKFAKDLVLNEVIVNFQTTQGKPQYSSAKYSDLIINNDNSKLIYNKIEDSKIELILGKDITYTFNIKKTLINNQETDLNFELNLPRPQHNQSLIIKNINPLPSYTYSDNSGNYFASYRISPGESKEIQILGFVIISENSSEQSLDFSQKRNNLVVDSIWNLTDQKEIQRFVLFNKINNIILTDNNIQGDKNVFIQNSYNYVIERLTPASKTDVSTRSGADNVISKVDSASPDDYTDFLISLLRKYGIPSRMVIGVIKPINVNEKSYIHNWVEYYTDDLGWVTLDPAYEDLSNTKYFGKTFVDHIAIIVRENNPYSPKLTNQLLSETVFESGVNKQDPIISAELKLVNENNSYFLQIKNTGNTIINSFSLESNIFEVSKLNQSNISVLPTQVYVLPLNQNSKSEVSKEYTSSITLYDTNLQSFRGVFSANLSNSISSENIVFKILLYSSLIMFGLIIIWLLFKKFSIIKNDKKIPR
jgi:hypothetical protein